MRLLEFLRRPQIDSEREFIKILSLCSDYAYMHANDFGVNMTDGQKKYFIHASEDIDHIISEYKCINGTLN